MSQTSDTSDLDEQLKHWEGRMPPWLARLFAWLRRPSSRYVRIPVAVLLVFGGFLSFLPVLGLWMLPLGLILIAQDVPFLAAPLARMLAWAERRWFSDGKAQPASRK